MKFYSGDRIKVKDVPSVKRSLVGKLGVVIRWSTGIHYLVRVDITDYLVRDDEMDLVYGTPDVPERGD